MLQFKIGGLEHEHVTVTVLDRESPAATDFWDGNWLTTRVEIRTGGWHGRYDAALRSEEVAAFLHQVEQLHATLSGEARFETMEQQLLLVLRAGKHGQIGVEGVACDAPGTGNRLDFTLPELDQSYLPNLLQQLKAIERQHPVRGLPHP